MGRAATAVILALALSLPAGAETVCRYLSVTVNGQRILILYCWER